MKLIITGLEKNLEEILSKGCPSGVSIKSIPEDQSAHAMPPELVATVTLFVEWSQPIAQGLIAAWLYDKFKNIKSSVKINGTTDPTQKQIQDEINKISLKQENIENE